MSFCASHSKQHYKILKLNLFRHSFGVLLCIFAEMTCHLPINKLLSIHISFSLTLSPKLPHDNLDHNCNTFKLWQKLGTSLNFIDFGKYYKVVSLSWVITWTHILNPILNNISINMILQKAIIGHHPKCMTTLSIRLSNENMNEGILKNPSNCTWII